MGQQNDEAVAQWGSNDIVQQWHYGMGQQAWTAWCNMTSMDSMDSIASMDNMDSCGKHMRHVVSQHGSTMAHGTAVQHKVQHGTAR